MSGQPEAGESRVVPFLRAGPPPDRTRSDGWQQWRAARGSFTPAPRLSPAEYQALSPRCRALHDLHRTATHVNLRLQETPMSRKVSDLMRGRLQNHAVKFTPGTRDGLMISGGGFQGKTETACQAAAEFEDLWRDIRGSSPPGPSPGPGTCSRRSLTAGSRSGRRPRHCARRSWTSTATRTPPPCTTWSGRSRDAVRDHATTALLIDDITRLRLHRGDDQDTLDLIRELMDIGATLVLIGVDIPGSGLLRSARPDPSAGQWAFPAAAHGDAVATQTGRRFDLVDLGPFDYSTPAGITAFIGHLAGIEDQLRLLRSALACSPPGRCPSTCSAAPTASSGCSAASSRTAAPRRSPPARNGSPANCWPALPSAWAASPASTPRLARSRTSLRTTTRRRGRRRSAGPGMRSSTITAPGRPPVSSRPLGRSLDPLPGESLNGFLLRLSYRLRLSPARLARLAGIVPPDAAGLPRRLLLDLDAGSLAAFARLSGHEASPLHPAQCRLPGAAGPGSRRPGRQPCGQRLDEHHVSGPEPEQLPPGALALQQRLLAMLGDPGYPAGTLPPTSPICASSRQCSA
jgi:hypothetical protein